MQPSGQRWRHCGGCVAWNGLIGKQSDGAGTVFALHVGRGYSLQHVVHVTAAVAMVGGICMRRVHAPSQACLPPSTQGVLQVVFAPIRWARVLWLVDQACAWVIMCRGPLVRIGSDSESLRLLGRPACMHMDCVLPWLCLVRGLGGSSALLAPHLHSLWDTCAALLTCVPAVACQC